ncbi:hypothetical protein EG329_014118 [Mollisiaceae sp. DMI_Dod_QoI]|nr:hypothetical protein EG329_014118 [Helotiales sp. DMI_Dod_QoI]
MPPNASLRSSGESRYRASYPKMSRLARDTQMWLAGGLDATLHSERGSVRTNESRPFSVAAFFILHDDGALPALPVQDLQDLQESEPSEPSDVAGMSVQEQVDASGKKITSTNELSCLRPAIAVAGARACDQGVPACGQCIKAQKECSGYRNMLDLAFRNESESVIEKAKAKSRKAPPRSKEASPNPTKSSHEAATPDASASAPLAVVLSNLPQPAGDVRGFPTLFFDDGDWLNTNQGLPLFDLSTCYMQPTIENQGFNYFISNFVRSPSGPSHGQFAYLDDLCRRGALDDTLQAAITAAGLAGHATKTKSSPLMARARKEYAIALRKINAALRSPVEALKDRTLLSIIIVAIFENIAGAKQLSLKEWTEHINGAATLIKLRGRDQLKRRSSLGLFMHATSHVLISCLQREIPMPSQLMELRAEAFSYLPVDPCYQYLRITEEFTLFRGAVNSGAFKDPGAVITRALMIDNDLVRSFTDVPNGWLYESAFTDPNCEIVFDGSYDIYYDHWIAQMWNAFRASRIMIHETIRTYIKGFASSPSIFTPPEFHAQVQSSASICIQMRDEIFRSVPQHLGFVTRKPFTSTHNSRPSSPLYVPDLSSEVQQPQDINSTTSFTDAFLNDAFIPPLPQKEFLYLDPAHPLIGGYFLLWPLYVAGITRVSTIEHKIFVAKTLQYVGETMGIRAGSNMAAFMREHSMVPPVVENLKGKMGSVAARFQSDILADDRPKKPLYVMLAREEEERAERLRVGRAEAQII